MQNNQDPRSSGSQNPAPRKKRKKKGSTAGRVFANIGKVLGTLLLVGVTTGAILACFAAVYIKTVILPKASIDLNQLSMEVTLSSKLYYNDENETPQELRSIYGSSNRVWVKYKDIPEDLINATIAIEDKRFWSHHGVDWIRTGRSVLDMFTGGNIQGGSTLTQQFIKNATQNDEVTVQRKILEIFQALEFEKEHTKEEVLEWYLNYIYLGRRCYGVYTASYMYFGKDVSQLSLAECASLISITNNPSIYDPYMDGKAEDGSYDPDWGRKNNAERASNVINEMLKQGKITQSEADEAWAQIKSGLNFARGQEEETHEDTVYTWFEDQVIKDVINGLKDAGYSEQAAEYMVYYGGLQIYTCLDPKVQGIVDSVYGDMANLPYTSSSGQQLQSGITIVDPNGYVVALSGGMGEKKGSRIYSLATSQRSPGSSFKTLSTYAPAIDMGLLTPYSVLDDVPVSADNGKAYPNNSYGYYKGRMTVREGVYLSSNPLAMRTIEMLTPQVSFDFLTQKLGFGDELVQGRDVNGKVATDIAYAPLALGGLTDGVSTFRMAGAYATFPRGGTYLEPITFTQVKDSKGNIILDNTADRYPNPVVKETTAAYINSLLYNVVNLRGVGATGTDAYFDGMTIAGKTGSTDANKDRWFVGYTPYYTAAVWCGYKQPERIKADGNPAAKLWNKVMSQVHAGLEDKSFPKPDGMTEVAICADSGMLATTQCKMDPRGGRVITGTYFPGDAPGQYCTMHNTTAFPNGSMATVCLDSPFLDSNGNPTGMYHLAGEFCPEDRRSTIYLLDFDRDLLGGVYTARDQSATLTYIRSLGDAAKCTVHTEPIPYDPATFNIEDKTTWPTEEQWPGFDPLDEVTWPNYVPPTDEPTEPPIPTEPGQTTEPGHTPEPGHSTPPTQTPPATPPPGIEVTDPTETEQPPDEPFVPAA